MATDWEAVPDNEVLGRAAQVTEQELEAEVAWVQRYLGFELSPPQAAFVRERLQAGSIVYWKDIKQMIAKYPDQDWWTW